MQLEPSRAKESARIANVTARLRSWTIVPMRQNMHLRDVRWFWQSVGLLSLAASLGACGDEAPVTAPPADSQPKPEDNSAGADSGSHNGSKPVTGSSGGVLFDDMMSFSWPAAASRIGVAGGTKVTGNLTVSAGTYRFSLAEATIVYSTDANGHVKTFTGTAKVSMPALHTYSGVGLGGSPLAASFGYNLGSELTNLDLPLAPERKYLYFTFTAGFNASFGTGPFSANTSMTQTVVFDQRDPAILFAGPMGPLSAVGLSEHGQIPFSAKTTWGFDTPESEFPTFRGQSYVAGEVSLEEIPITVSGDVTTAYTGWDGQSSLNKTLFDHTVGVNGSFNLGWDFADGLFRLEVPLAKASMYLSTTGHPYKGVAAVSGTAGTSTFLPSWLPVLLSKNAYLAGYLDTADVAKNHIDGASEMTIHASTLGDVAGIKMNDLQLASGSFHADRIGFRFNGQSTVGLTPELVSDSMKVTACFGGDPVACLSDDQAGHPVAGSKDWILRMEGSSTLLGVPLVSATATASPKGVTIGATYRTALSDTVMTGSITSGSKVLVTGSTTFALTLNEVNQVVQEVETAVICGYQEVTNIAKCGFSLGNFGDEFHCGKPHCSWSWKHGLRCKALSCQVQVPKTCSDLSKPIHCPKVPPPPFNLGSVSGTVALTIGNAGIGGKASAKFCPPSGACSNMASGGSLDFSTISHPKICFNASEISSSIPSGRYCVGF